MAIRERRAHQGVAFFQLQGDQAARPGPGKLGKLGFLDRAVGRGHEHEMPVVVFLDGQQGGHPLALGEGQHVDQGPALGAAAALGNLEHPQPIDLAQIGEAQQGVVAVRHQQALDEILVAHLGRRPAPPASALRLIGVQRLRLGVALVGNGRHQVFLGDQVLHGEILLGGDDLRAPLVAIGFHQLRQLLAHHLL